MSQTCPVYRIGYASSLWTPSSSFKNRFDDPDKKYRVLYVSSQPLGCYLECMASFRRGILPGLSAISNSPADYLPSGVVPLNWIEKNAIGSATLRGTFADISSAEWISRLRSPLSQLLASAGISDFDSSVLKQAMHRQITQAASRLVRAAGYDGIYYRSRWGDDLENWAVFEPWTVDSMNSQPLNVTDPDFILALELLNLSVEVV